MTNIETGVDVIAEYEMGDSRLAEIARQGMGFDKDPDHGLTSREELAGEAPSSSYTFLEVAHAGLRNMYDRISSPVVEHYRVRKAAKALGIALVGTVALETTRRAFRHSH